MHFPYQGDIVWPVVMEVFAENRINIRTLERAGGIVTGEYRGDPAPEGACDCGAGMLRRPIRDTLTYIVFMREAPNGTTTCTNKVAERVGFEPTRRYNRLLELQSSAFVHSATSPHEESGARIHRPAETRQL